jgi:protein O-GlcNAc transferase
LDISSQLQRAVQLQLRGEARRAETVYLRVLQEQPKNATALHMLGVLATAAGNAQRALGLIADSIAVDPYQAAAYSNLGHALMALGRHHEAVECFNKALGLSPRYAIALTNRGISLLHLARYEQAVDSFSRSLNEVPQSPGTLLNRAIALAKLGRLEEAIADYERAIALKPDYVEPAFNRAVLLATLGRTGEAVAGYDSVVSLDPNHVEALNSRGVALMKLERVAEALASFDRALLLAPAMADAHNNRGLALRHLQRLDEALDSFDRALALRPDFPEALNNRGWILLPLGRPAEAIASLEQALAIKPDLVEALTNLGAVFKYCERLGEALSCFDRALVIDPDCQDALGNRGALLLQVHRYEEAIASFRRLIDLAPENDYALGNLLEAQLRCCDWAKSPGLIAKIVESLSSGRQAIRPFFYLAVTDDPARQLACARMYADRHCPAGDMVPFPSRRDRTGRLRVAYVSGDFGDHAVSYLATGLFEQHDRERFEVIAISLRPQQDSAIGRRVSSGFDHFLDVSAMSDKGIVARMREMEVHIAVDLSGYTGAARGAIFAQRAAPVQVNYLGYPATMGSSFMDYIIADEFVIPPQYQAHYAERVVYLPASFQVNDGRREISDSAPVRRDYGLPDRGFVFCSFNNSYKLSPAFFAVWLRLLAATPDSVLWLVADNERVENNLRGLATARQIAPQRLIFTRRLPYAEHLARLSLADLFLDCLPFNAGTTASDALWAGVPILTCAGSAFAARMAGSLLRAVGLPELITYNIEDYEALGLRLAGDPSLLAHYRARLAASHLSSPLFDTARFCRDIEWAYESMWGRYRRGDPPASFRVGKQPGRDTLDAGHRQNS